MSFPALDNYLARLQREPQAGTRVWLDAQGRAQGRYFNATLTSAFQPIRMLDSSRIVGYEGFARSYSKHDPGLCVWKLLDHSASDDESIELDRLCRMLHALNFYRQSDAPETRLFLSVHARLLAAVDGNHGIAFRRVLDALSLPHQNIVLQLPLVTQDQDWLLHYVSDNYRRNGFRLALNAADAEQALALLDRAQPDAIKLDARGAGDADIVLRLLLETAKRNIQLVFKRVEHADTVALLARLGTLSGQTIQVQGLFWDVPQAALASLNAPGMPPKQPHAALDQRRIA
jgi:EAL domain-containing protein (putative c-di-GMP-specific phosphodiesterase class I)